jgi:hypothetical protein
VSPGCHRRGRSAGQTSSRDAKPPWWEQGGQRCRHKGSRDPTAEQEAALGALVRAHSTPQKLTERACIILPAEAGKGMGETPSGAVAAGSADVYGPLERGARCLNGNKDDNRLVEVGRARVTKKAASENFTHPTSGNSAIRQLIEQSGFSNLAFFLLIPIHRPGPGPSGPHPTPHRLARRRT